MLSFIKSKTFLFIFFSYLIFFILTPPFQVPDEPEHYENIYWFSQFIYPRLPKANEKNYPLFIHPLFNLYDSTDVIRTANILPNFQKIKTSNLHQIVSLPKPLLGALRQISTQSYHPPIYYAFATLFFKLTAFLRLDLISAFYFVRLSSSVFYFLTVFVAYKILSSVCKKKESVNPLLIFFSINPVALKMGVGINNEIAVAFFSLLFLYLLLTYEKKIVILALVSGAATLSKFSGVFTALAFTLTACLRYKFSKKTFSVVLKYALVFLLILLPWFIFNYLRYHNPIQDNFSLICKKDFPSHSIFITAAYSLFEFRHTINHYAGFLGWGEPYPFKFFFVGYTVMFSVLFFIGTIRIILGSNRSLKILLSCVFSLFLFLFILDFYRKLSHYSCDIQGRYLLPAFLPITVVLAKGIKSERLLSYFAIFQYYFILFFVLIPKYYV